MSEEQEKRLIVVSEREHRWASYLSGRSPRPDEGRAPMLFAAIADRYEDGITEAEAIGASAAVTAVMESAPIGRPPTLVSSARKLRAAFSEDENG